MLIKRHPNCQKRPSLIYVTGITVCEEWRCWIHPEPCLSQCWYEMIVFRLKIKFICICLNYDPYICQSQRFTVPIYSRCASPWTTLPGGRCLRIWLHHITSASPRCPGWWTECQDTCVHWFPNIFGSQWIGAYSYEIVIEYNLDGLWTSIRIFQYSVEPS